MTAETWYPARDVVRMLDYYLIDHAHPSWPTNRWISAMFRLFKLEIAALIEQRDRVVTEWAATHPEDVYEDRGLEVTGELKISVDAQTARLEKLLGRGSAA